MQRVTYARGTLFYGVFSPTLGAITGQTQLGHDNTATGAYALEDNVPGDFNDDVGAGPVGQTAPNVTTARNKSMHGGRPIVWLAAINQRMNLPLVFRLLLTRDGSRIGRVRQDPAPVGNKFFWVAKIGIDRLWIFCD